MKQVTVTVSFPEGLHARPAIKLIKLVAGLDSSIEFSKDGEAFVPDSITAILGACITCGDQLTIAVQGGDEDTAIAALVEYFA